MQAWSPQHQKDVDLFEQVQRRAMKMTGELKHLSFKGRLTELGLFSPEKALSRPYSTFWYLKGVYKEEGEGCFHTGKQQEDSDFELKEETCRLDARRTLFTHRVVRDWYSLPRVIMSIPSLEVCKGGLDGALSNLFQECHPCSGQGAWNEISLRSPPTQTILQFYDSALKRVYPLDSNRQELA